MNTNLELAAGASSETDSRQFIEHARGQVERLEALTTGLLDLSRIETESRANTSAKVAKEHTVVKLADLVREISETYASRAEQAGISFLLEVSEKDVSVLGNQSQLRGALVNLLDNAVKFTPSGGQVRLATHSSAGWVRLTVEDDGIGIPEEDIILLFGRFHRGRNAGEFPSSGLGLAIVRAVVENHGGHIDVSDSNPGTAITVRLPLTG